MKFENIYTLTNTSTSFWSIIRLWGKVRPGPCVEKRGGETTLRTKGRNFLHATATMRANFAASGWVRRALKALFTRERSLETLVGFFSMIGGKLKKVKRSQSSVFRPICRQAQNSGVFKWNNLLNTNKKADEAAKTYSSEVRATTGQIRLTSEQKRDRTGRRRNGTALIIGRNGSRQDRGGPGRLHVNRTTSGRLNGAEQRFL